MNFHFVIDDKFTDDYIKEAEDIAPAQNIFYYIASKNPRYIKSKLGVVRKYGDALLQEVMNVLNPADRLFFQWLSPAAGRFIEKLPRENQKALFFMGGDLLEYPSSINKHWVYDPISLKYFDHKVPTLSYDAPISRLPQLGKKLFMDFIKPLYDRRRFRLKLKGERLLDYICTWNEYDIEFLKKRDGIKAKALFYNYGFGLQDEALTISDDKEETDYNIWLGNSCTLSNNHLDFFEKFRNSPKPINYKLYVPLSYGDKELRAYLIAKGTEYFGDHFIPIVDFLPRDEYYKLMTSCQYFIMYHNRMQAAGNIFAILKMGGKLFMKLESTSYKQYFEAGASICDVNTIFDGPEVFTPLAAELVASNQLAVERLTNPELKMKTLKYLFT